MLCNTPHDFREIACSSSQGSLPAPVSSRSITNLGMCPLHLLTRARFARSYGKMRIKTSPVVGRRSRSDKLIFLGAGTAVPASTSTGAGSESGIAGAHNRLIPVLDLNLVEHPGDMIAHGFFRQAESGGDLAVIEPVGDVFEN